MILAGDIGGTNESNEYVAIGIEHNFSLGTGVTR